MEGVELVAGRYELVKRLGRGGMGEVWAARDRVLHRDIALKLLAVENGALSDDLPRRFEREAVAAAQINHPNVVALYDRGAHEDMRFLVMEKVDGTTLSERVRYGGPMTVDVALAIAEGVCTALVAAHRAGVVHYDIKPANIMLTPDGGVKVVDFGIAGFLQAAFTVARSSQLIPAGTPEYGAPEQFLTERGDERSDLYSLGAVLFALLTGRPPITGPNALAVVRRKLDEDAPDLTTLRPDAPTALAGLIAALLQRAPRDRPHSAQQVLQQLRRLRAPVGYAAPERQALLAELAWAMRSLVHAVPRLAQTRSTSTLPTLSHGDGRAVAPTRRLPADTGAFTVEWTGRERLSAYADTVVNLDRRLRRWGIAMVLLFPVIAVDVRVLSLLWSGENLSFDGVGYYVQAVVLFSAIPLFCYCAWRCWQNLRIARRHGDKGGWTLHIGPHYIQTRGTTGSREFSWENIQRVSVEEIQGSSPYAYTGVHILPAGGSGPPRTLQPAGWPRIRGMGGGFRKVSGQLEKREDGLIPLCVLGPMTQQQRTELAEALTRHGGSRAQSVAPA